MRSTDPPPSTLISKQRSAVISLDFELRWGIHDVYRFDLEASRANIERLRDAVPALVKLLVDRDIRATWAIVGAIACRSWNDYFTRAPEPPRYERPGLAVDPRYADLDPEGTLHFAPDLVQTIASAPGQLLGTHTFSHLYLREKGVTPADLAADLIATAALYRERYATIPRSLVFPRNQCAFIDVVRASSIRIWRGNQKAWYYEREDSEHYNIVPRVLKLVDELNPFSTRAAPLEGDMTRASLFLRLSLPDLLWHAHLQRIRRELRSLQPGHVFHIWFHPDTLGEDAKIRLSRVEQVLEMLATMRERDGIRLCAMEDLVA